MEIAEILEFCTQFDIGGKLLDLIIIILYLCGKRKTAEELEAKKRAKKEKEAQKHEKKANHYAKKAQNELFKQAKIEEELEK